MDGVFYSEEKYTQVFPGENPVKINFWSPMSSSNDIVFNSMVL